MFFTALRTALFAALALASVSTAASAAGNANRGIAPATDAKTCGQLVKDTREMLNETEVTEDVDKQVEAMIKEASAQCKASDFGKATDTVVQARALLTKE
ncbi:hypothetical protein T8K17_06070 [Thalassobaculum sp. OXR-137]|uniref:hypothetical protein n=1 Tax=Thalassobaculum sp. OXR-137 TaxID=3100173 RepID=UPI002AC98EAD|nr:hypothetical protein [Thalassobaculum sp. OXR-137]WPZ35705.1 hypothetical protein T8K17_06070 [Thalassobaculum sp. OXR-137]